MSDQLAWQTIYEQKYSLQIDSIQAFSSGSNFFGGKGAVVLHKNLTTNHDKLNNVLFPAIILNHAILCSIISSCSFLFLYMFIIPVVIVGF